MAWKRWMAGNLAVMLLALLCSALCLRAAVDNGFNGLKTVEAYQNLAAYIPVRNVLDNADSAMLLEDEDISQAVNKLNNYAQNIRSAGGTVQIMVVEATSELVFCGDASCVQRAVVKQVLSGEAIEGETVEISRMGGIRLLNGEMCFTGFISYGTNVMLSGKQYLVFCQPIEDLDALEHYGTDYWKFEAFAVGYSVVCLTDCENVLLSAQERTTDWVGNEYLAYHQESIDSMLRLKAAILEEYGLAQ